MSVSNDHPLVLKITFLIIILSSKISNEEPSYVFIIPISSDVLGVRTAYPKILITEQFWINSDYLFKMAGESKLTKQCLDLTKHVLTAKAGSYDNEYSCIACPGGIKLHL